MRTNKNWVKAYKKLGKILISITKSNLISHKSTLVFRNQQQSNFGRQGQVSRLSARNFVKLLKVSSFLILDIS